MNDIVTGQDTIYLSLGAGSSTYGSDANPDYTIDSLSYFFTGDINTTGTKVKTTLANANQSDSNNPEDVNANNYQSLNGSTFYRWASAPSEHSNKFVGNSAPRRLDKSTDGFDVRLSLP